MRVVAALVVAALCLQVAHGAVTLRFINTVPNRRTATNALLQNPAINGAGANAFARDAGTNYNLVQDRIGLHYFPASQNNNLNDPTTVWTEPNRGYANAANVGQNHGVLQTTTQHTRNFHYQMGMPPLRGYHTSVGATETAAIDRVAPYVKCTSDQANPGSANTATCHANSHDAAGIAADNAAVVANNGLWPTYDENMDRLGLKADGVGQFLTFAAGTYKMQAYGVPGTVDNTKTATDIANGNLFQFTASLSTFEFKDWKMYTLIASGDADWANSAATPSVSLTLIEESVAPTTFGKAALRFFHAVNSQSTQALDVYRGPSVATATKVITGLSFRSTSAYMDVDPSTSTVFPLAYGDASVTTVQTGIPVTLDTRVGTRATVVCAMNDLVLRTVFCRQIPSRVVAYVRLVHDMKSLSERYVQGKFGPQKWSETGVSVWGSWDFPMPSLLDDTNQQTGSAVVANSAALSTGLYPVLGEVAPGSISGYGEVHVPLYIMDTAVVQNVFRSGSITGDATIKSSDFFEGGNAGSTVGKVDGVGYDYSARYKRVNLIVKTDGFATVTDRRRDNVADFKNNRAGEWSWANGAPTAVTTGSQTTSTVDIMMEPGQYYTLFITPSMDTTSTLLVVEDTGSSANPQNGGAVEFGLAIDRGIDDLAQGVTPGKSRLRFMAFGYTNIAQSPFTSGTFTTGSLIRQFGTAAPSNNGQVAAVCSTANANTVTITPAVAGVGETTGHQICSNYVRLDPSSRYLAQQRLPAVSSVLDLAPGDYTFKFEKTATDTCAYTINPKDLSLKEGEVTTIYVLGWWGCQKGATKDPSQLETHVVKETAFSTTPAVASTQTFFGAASTTSVSVSLMFAAALAILALVF